MNKCIVRKQGKEGVIKISHYYMGEIARLCLYTIKNTEEKNLKNIRSKKILERIQKYLTQTEKNKEFFDNVRKQETTGVLPI